MSRFGSNPTRRSAPLAPPSPQGGGRIGEYRKETLLSPRRVRRLMAALAGVDRGIERAVGELALMQARLMVAAEDLKSGAGAPPSPEKAAPALVGPVQPASPAPSGISPPPSFDPAGGESPPAEAFVVSSLPPPADDDSVHVALPDELYGRLMVRAGALKMTPRALAEKFLTEGLDDFDQLDADLDRAAEEIAA